MWPAELFKDTYQVAIAVIGVVVAVDIAVVHVGEYGPWVWTINLVYHVNW